MLWTKGEAAELVVLISYRHRTILWGKCQLFSFEIERTSSKNHVFVIFHQGVDHLYMIQSAPCVLLVCIHETEGPTLPILGSPDM